MTDLNPKGSLFSEKVNPDKSDEVALLDFARETEKEVLARESKNKLVGKTKEGYPCDQAALDADFQETVNDIVKSELAERLDELSTFFEEQAEEVLGYEQAEKLKKLDAKVTRRLVMKMLFENKKIPQIAKKLYLTVKEVYLIIGNAKFDAEYLAWQDQMETNLRRLVSKRIASVSPEALERQIQIMRTSKNERLVRDISNDLLNRGGHKKVEEVAPLVKLTVIGLDADKHAQMLGLSDHVDVESRELSNAEIAMELEDSADRDSKEHVGSGRED